MSVKDDKALAYRSMWAACWEVFQEAESFTKCPKNLPSLSMLIGRVKKCANYERIYCDLCEKELVEEFKEKRKEPREIKLKRQIAPEPPKEEEVGFGGIFDLKIG